jgi:hypothetical protein
MCEGVKMLELWSRRPFKAAMFRESIQATNLSLNIKCIGDHFVVIIFTQQSGVTISYRALFFSNRAFYKIIYKPKDYFYMYRALYLC